MRNTSPNNACKTSPAFRKGVAVGVLLCTVVSTALFSMWWTVAGTGMFFQQQPEQVNQERDCVTRTRQPTVVVKNKNNNNDGVSNDNSSMTMDYENHCVIHIHGIHHSGTGYLRKTVYDSLGGSDRCSQHDVPQKVAYESEGQHLQNVYPNFQKRKHLCLPSWIARNHGEYRKHIGKLYYCQAILRLAEKEDNKHKLYRQWARYWNMSKPYLIQKTPTLDVLLLEKMKLSPTAHVAVVGHPITGQRMEHNDRNTYSQALMRTWIDTWAHVLQQMANQEVQLYAVVNFETLILHHQQVSLELSNLIRGGCGIESSNNQQQQKQRRRRLELHGHKNSTTFLKPRKGTFKWTKCLTNPVCTDMMKDLAPVMAEFGYTWNMDAPYQQEFREGSSVLLFSSNNPPPRSLVDKMLALAKKYTALPRTATSITSLVQVNGQMKNGNNIQTNDDENEDNDDDHDDDDDDDDENEDENDGRDDDSFGKRGNYNGDDGIEEI